MALVNRLPGSKAYEYKSVAIIIELFSLAPCTKLTSISLYYAIVILGGE